MHYINLHFDEDLVDDNSLFEIGEFNMNRHSFSFELLRKDGLIPVYGTEKLINSHTVAQNVPLAKQVLIQQKKRLMIYMIKIQW